MEEWIFNMNAPLPGEGKREPTQADWEQDGESFMAAMSALKGMQKG